MPEQPPKRMMPRPSKGTKLVVVLGLLFVLAASGVYVYFFKSHDVTARLISQYSLSTKKFPYTEATNKKIDNADEYKQLLTQLFPGQDTSALSVDFDRYSVLFVSGTPKQETIVDIASVKETMFDIKVNVDHKVCNRGSVASVPIEILTIPRTDKRVHFVSRNQSQDCNVTPFG